ncbi:MAG: flagellin [Candidatus Accumulibacter phosphatis]|uniref:Flagellin n=4 Tax=Candidatus Accumulibacter TaxID=327159 RepID=A0A080M851_9PROT|nr:MULTISPECIES: flagellin [Candidatus Accumulibacter]KFB77477.1 MAG: B-type flagellin [Candidatus Accumulibacter cognatus]MBL8402784.1 flagellin [Accumulibacter sp.]MBN8517969.1 flagellin [Accumulibacter sp.]MBO3709725.1 flagellin [Accumulibacter sp.]MCC2868402.1 flagellin [Candidatus Accumulibacter phosphatis]
MPQIINTNVASLNSQRSLNMSQASLSTSLQRLSSGLRINSAKDDAAGLAISTRMSSQVTGLNQASRNANDGISLAQTAEGGLQSITDSLQRMRELSVQASNATNTATDRAALQQEVDTLVQQINTVASQTAFNGVKLLDGTFNAQSFQIGANSGEALTINSLASAKADALGVGTTSSFSSTTAGAVATGAIAAGGITVNGFGIGPSVRDGLSAAGSNDSAISKAAAFNAVSGQTGVTAKASATTLAGIANTAQAAIAGDATDFIYVNNVKLGAIAAGADAVTQGANVAAAFNAVSNQSGVTATFSTSTGAVSLTAADGRNISLIGAGTGADIANTGLTIGAGGDIVAAGASTGAALAAGDLTINGYDIGAVAADAAATPGNNLAAAINALTSKTGVTATNNSGTLTLSAGEGQAITISGNLAHATATETATGFSADQLGAGADETANAASSNAVITRGNITLSSTNSAGITLSGSDIARSGLSSAYTAATATFGAGIASVDLTTATGAQNAIATIDSALANINSSRANLGALQNRFASVVSNLATTSENLTASRSRILDADFAAETANLSRGQIMQQAGTAMLAQANSLPQGVLSLLRG